MTKGNENTPDQIPGQTLTLKRLVKMQRRDRSLINEDFTERACFL